MSAIWIDERKHRDPERMRQAMFKARQKTIERHYSTYRLGRPYKPRVQRSVTRDYIEAAIVILLLCLLAGLSG